MSLRLARRYAVEIVSVDSAMVYRGMDVGTAKPGAAERGEVPHHLIDIADPWESYSAGAFRADALRVVDEIHRRGNWPLLVGGTMLYFRVLRRGLAELPAADVAVRQSIDAEASRDGWPALHARLALIDPVAAGRIRPADRQRIQRALEVHRLTGQPISTLQTSASATGALPSLGIALRPTDRAALYRALDARLLAMLGAGLVDEVRCLKELPLMSADAPSMRAVGYRQIWDYLAGGTTLDEASAKAQLATRHLAKRQLTWMRTEGADLTVDSDDPDGERLIDRFLQVAGVSRRT